MDHLGTTIQDGMKECESMYSSDTHDSIMKSVRSLKNPFTWSVRAFFLISGLVAFFSGWRIGGTMLETDALSFLRVAFDGLLVDLQTAPYFSEMIFEFIPLQWTLVFTLDCIILLAGIVSIKKRHVVS